MSDTETTCHLCHAFWALLQSTKDYHTLLYTALVFVLISTICDPDLPVGNEPVHSCVLVSNDTIAAAIEQRF